MKNNRLGYVAIEAVITGALILSVGFFALLSLSGHGTAASSKAMAKLDGTGVFESSGTITQPSAEIEYDANGYDKTLNIKTADINPLSDFEFEDMGSSYRIINYLNMSRMDVIVPSKYSDGKPITGIGAMSSNATMEGKSLTSVVLPNTITEIYSFAFAYSELKGISIPDSVTYLGDNAFQLNQSLTSVTLSKNLTSIPMNAFDGSPLTALSLPNGITEIGEYAFQYNNAPTIVIPATVQRIGQNAFKYNDKITSLTLNEGLTSIGVEAFAYNTITSLIIPSTVVEIGKGAFSMSGLTSIEFKGNVPTVIDPNGQYDGQEDIPGIIENGVFGFCNLGAHSIKVPVGQLAVYQANTASFGVSMDAFYE